MSTISEIKKHINFMERYNSIDKSQFEVRIKIAKAQKNNVKLTEIHEELLSKILKGAKVNFIIKNLPKYGQTQNSTVQTEVNAKSIHDTMKEFGKVNDAVVFRNSAYVWFESNNEAKFVHSLINNMQLGNNIINTMVLA